MPAPMAQPVVSANSPRKLNLNRRCLSGAVTNQTKKRITATAKNARDVHSVNNSIKGLLTPLFLAIAGVTDRNSAELAKQTNPQAQSGNE